MATWRDTASEQAQADLDGLLNPALEFAQQQLAKHGEFLPYAVAITATGGIEMINARPDPSDDHPRPVDVIVACLGVLRSRRSDLRAAAIISDVHLPDLHCDAIDVALEHVEGQALRVQLPYARRPLRKRINYGQLRAIGTERRIWSHS
jgi:hypothetical protein